MASDEPSSRISLESDRYAARGVSSSKDAVHAAISELDAGLFPGAFAKLYPDTLTGSSAHCLAIHADGAGTKSSLAHIHYGCFGDPSIFAGIAQDSLVMNLDDLLCVGATGPFLLSNTIGRNAKRVGGEVIEALVAGYAAQCAQLAEHGVDVQMTGGESADVGDLVRTVIVDSTLTARLAQDEVVDAAQAQVGHVIVGLASAGQTTYESRYNSGIGSNGLTQARHDALGTSIRTRFPESFAPEVEAVAYQGPADEHTPLPDTPLTVLEALLSPTRSYAPLIVPLLRDSGQGPRSPISSLLHITGGGQLKPKRFGRGVRYVKDNLLPMPPLFRWLQRVSGASFAEMAQVFNLGHRFEVICEASFASEVIARSQALGLEAQCVGRVEASGQAENQVVLEHAGERVEA